MRSIEEFFKINKKVMFKFLSTERALLEENDNAAKKLKRRRSLIFPSLIYKLKRAKRRRSVILEKQLAEEHINQIKFNQEKVDSNIRLIKLRLLDSMKTMIDQAGGLNVQKTASWNLYYLRLKRRT